MARRFRTKQEWLDLIQKWKQSGLGVGTFCKQESISEGRFYEVRKRIDAGVARQSKKKSDNKPKFVPVEIKAAVNNLSEQKASGYLEIVTPTGYMIRIH